MREELKKEDCWDLESVYKNIDDYNKDYNIVKENIVFAIAIKILVLILCALGRTSMWAAVFADVGVSILAILNALRILKIRKEC